MTTASRFADEVLEATVLGSFTNVGYNVRSRLEHWSGPPSMKGKVALVTGGTSGLGLQTCQSLASLGATLRFVARDAAKARHARDEIKRVSGNDDVDFTLANMADLGAVAEVAAWMAESAEVLNVLVHNAGAISKTRAVNDRGVERTVASQVLGPFLLTTLLLDQLGGGAPGRVVNVSSGGMYSQRFDLANLEMDAQRYKGVTQYARAKRAQVVLTHEWARRVEPASVLFFSVHPGWVNTPGIHLSLPVFARALRPLLRSPHEGADTTIWLATSLDAAPSGAFFHDRHRRFEHKVPWTRAKNAAIDQRQLWTWCKSRTL